MNTKLEAMEPGTVTVLKSSFLPEGQTMRGCSGLAVAYRVNDLYDWVAEWHPVPDGFRRILTILSIRPVVDHEEIVEFSWIVRDANRDLSRSSGSGPDAVPGGDARF